MSDEALGTILDALAVIGTFSYWRGRVKSPSWETGNAYVEIDGSRYLIKVEKVD